MLNMHRPSDQAKLLFFALLRGTVSALATEPKSLAVNAVKNGAVVATPPILSPNIQLRLAKRADVPSIQKCNLATLPENYNSQFYVNHLRQWPDLCLVAEDVMELPEGNEEKQHSQRSFGTTFTALGQRSMSSPSTESNVVAYVLGKVEERPPPMPSSFYAEGYRLGDPRGDENDDERFIGHVTSLAVLQPYRRQGLAAALMKQLHFHLEESYKARSVGLHVRKSNEAACRLYQEFGYQIDLTIPGYYQDGEDAYFMKKPLLSPTSEQQLRLNHNAEGLKLPFLGRKAQQPWERGPLDYRLPRSLSSQDNDNRHIGGRLEEPAADEQSPELLTGSM